MYHIRFAKALVRRDQLLIETDPPAQVDRPRDIGDEVIGAVFNQVAVAPRGLQDTSELRASLQ